MRIAFNSTVEFKKPLMVKDNTKIEIKILRNIAQLAMDNNSRILNIKPNKKIRIEKAKEIANVVMVSMNK